MVERAGTHFKIRKHEPLQETSLYKARRHKENFQRDSIEEDAQILATKNWKPEVLNRNK
jgi:hypothetical protein